MQLRPLSNELQNIAIERLHEDPARIKDDVLHIREWIDKQPHLNARTDEQWLVTFLRGCKYSLEKTKSKIDMYYTMRSLAPEFYTNRDPMLPEIQDVLDLGYFFPLLNDESSVSPRLVLVRAAAYDPTKYSPELLIKVLLMMADIALLEDDQFVVAGSRMISDLDGITLAHIWSPSALKKSMYCFIDAFPMMLKGMHYINAPGIFETMYSLVKPFYPEKLKQRVSVHNDKKLDDLEKFFPLSLLPKEYGGEGESIESHTKIFKKKVESYRDWFLEDAKYGTNESKRLGKPKTSDEYFGIEGSFRKLNVD